MSILKIHEADNVAVALKNIKKGEEITVQFTMIPVLEDIDRGHKIALQDLQQNEHVIKYGFPIGHVTVDVKAGQWIHSHNIKTNLGEMLEYTYEPELPEEQPVTCNQTFKGYRREDGRIGVRNEIWIIPTVGCVNRAAQLLAKQGNDSAGSKIDGVFEFTHPYGCSQLGEDHHVTQQMLAALVNHPNAGGVLVLGLGCENNNIPEFKKILGDYDPARVKSYNQPIYENPSPGNKKGGISTLEEKSLGCTQKGGRSIVVDVLGYGETVKNKGLNLLNGPGNDAVAATALAAAGCHIVLFTTGRGTPLGTAVPTIKVWRRTVNYLSVNPIGWILTLVN